MIEVLKTNVTERCHANMIIERIQDTLAGHQANFDLEDCDKILRVKCSLGNVRLSCLMDILKNLGFYAEVLTD